jgi:hypothetical protein
MEISMKNLSHFETMLVSGGGGASCIWDSGSWTCTGDWAMGTLGGDFVIGGDDGAWVIDADGNGTYYPNP